MKRSPKPKTTTQAPSTQGSSAKINYATGSGSRPTGGHFKIETTAPASPQKIRS